MKILTTKSWMVLCALALLLAGQAAWAQQANVPARIVEAVDDTQTVTLQGNVHPLLRVRFDQGPVSDATPATRMLLLLQRSPQQEAALRQLLDQQQDKTSSNYHAWLTPAQFGTQFGPADADIQAVTGWLQSHGFQNVKVGAGRTTIEFSGNVGQVRNAFHTDIHRFLINGEQHLANVSNPQIPAALAPVLAGVMGLNDFRPKSHMRRVKNFLGGKVTGSGPHPAVSFTCSSGPCYGIAPADFAKIYNVPNNLTGSGVPIAIVQDSNINISDVQQFGNVFGVSNLANFSASNIIVSGPDPGNLGGDAEGEALLDTEWSGAVAQGATIDLVVTQDTETIGESGVDLSANYIIQNNLAPIMSESFGTCEADLFSNGSNGNLFYYYLWEQAAAQGITVILSTGDTGSDSCDAIASPQQDFSTSGLSVSGLASTPFNVAVGGTDFNYGGSPTTYWATPGGTTESANSYIPESTWNSGCAATATAGNIAANNCTSTVITNDATNESFADLEGGGGGESNCATLNNAGTACSGGNPLPSWQTGIPNVNTYRDIPDISLYSAVNTNSNTFLIMCQQDSIKQNGSACSLTGQTPEITPIGGTSAAAPAFAGIMALVVQQQGGEPNGRQGNANYALYQIYKNNLNNANTICASTAANVSKTGCIFYDTQMGNNSVACAGHSPNCSNTSTAANAYGILVDPNAGTNPGFLSVAGYDKATGLGSVNVTNLATAWKSVNFTPATITLSNPSPTSIAHGGQVSFTVTVAPSSGTGTTPTGSVVLIATPPSPPSPVTIGAFTNSTSTSPAPTFVLNTGGTAAITTNALPGGNNYQVVAQYSGDGTYAPSSSPPVDVTVSQENSLTSLSFWTYDATDGLYDSQLTGSPVSVQYGTSYIMRVDVTNTAGTQCENGTVPCPTGTITETYDGQPLNDFSGGTADYATLNALGFLEDLPINLPASSTAHTVKAVYSGDNSYVGSTGTAPLLVSQAPTSTSVASSLGVITSGTSVTLIATVATQSGGDPPCGITNSGTVAFTSNGTALSGTVTYTPIAATSTTGAACTAALKTAISGLYPPGTVRPGPPSVPLAPVVVALLSLLLFLLGLRWLPEGQRRAYAYAGLVAFALLVVGIVGCGGGGGGGGGTRTITATYSGDTNYTTSSGSTSITVQ